MSNEPKELKFILSEAINRNHLAAWLAANADQVVGVTNAPCACVIHRWLSETVDEALGQHFEIHCNFLCIGPAGEDDGPSEERAYIPIWAIRFLHELDGPDPHKEEPVTGAQALACLEKVAVY